MKRSLRAGLGVAGVLVLTAIVSQCKSSGSPGSSDKATIDATAVATGIEEISSIIPICHTGSGLRAPGSVAPTGRTAWVARLLDLHKSGRLRAGPGRGNL